jgi:hypothetical protein
VLLVQVLATQRRDGGRHVLQSFFAPLGGDDDLFQHADIRGLRDSLAGGEQRHDCER